MELVKKRKSPKKQGNGFSEAPYMVKCQELLRLQGMVLLVQHRLVSKDTASVFSLAMDAKADKQIEMHMKREI